MNENPTVDDWAAERGEKWRSQLAGMEAMLAPVNEPLIRALKLDGPARIADIGCGGGATTLEILRRTPAGSVVHGFDISPASIESARNQIPHDQSAIAFEVADMASALPPGEVYDRLVSRFGVMFFDHPHSAFANLLHWLAPAGRFAFAVWGRQAENPWMTTVRQAVAEIIDMPPTDSDAPGPFRYAEANRLLTLLEGAGFGELVVEDWRGALPVGGGIPAAEAANFAVAAFSTFGELLAQAGEEALNQARQSLTARFVKHEHDGAVRMDACVHIFTGVANLR